MRCFTEYELITLPLIHVAVCWVQEIEAQQLQIHHWALLLYVAPALSGATGRWRWGRQVRVSRAAVTVFKMLVVVVGVRMG